MTASRRQASPDSIFALTTICVGFLLSVADRQILSLVSTHVKPEFGVSDTAPGLISRLGLGIFYSLLSLPLARLAGGFARLFGALPVLALMEYDRALARSPLPATA